MQAQIFSRKNLYIWFGLAVWIVLAGWASLQPSTQGSPDEAANAYFTRQVAANGQLEVDAATQFTLTADQLAYWHPRSIRAAGTNLQLLSFPGLPLAGGLIDRLLGRDLDRLLTPFLALFGLFALYRILRRFWSSWWAWLGTALVALHPVWWEFTTLPYFHNGAFAALLIVTGWRLMRLWDSHRSVDAVWTGLAFGAALFFRPVEVLWTGPLLAIVLLAQRQWKNLALTTLITLVVQLAWWVPGWATYGPSLGAGYSSAVVSQAGSVVTRSSATLWSILTPPGGWSWHWLSSTGWYLGMLLPSWTLAALVGFVFYLKRIWPQRGKVLKISLVTIFVVFPLVYYGSWDLYPLEAPGTVGALASYARYWIPLYVAMVVGVLWFLKRLRKQPVLLALAMTGLCVSQVTAIIWHPNSGLLHRLDQDRMQVTKRQAVLEQTPADAAIIAGHMDKVLFPDRIVAFRLPSTEAAWAAVESLAGTRPVYVYGTPRQYDSENLETQLRTHHLSLGPRAAIGSDSLWEVRPL